MLVLSRKAGEKIMIGQEIELEVVAICGDRVRIGVTAPKSTTVDRKEVADAKKAAGVQ